MGRAKSSAHMGESQHNFIHNSRRNSPIQRLEPTTPSSTLYIGEISYNLTFLCVGDLGPNLEYGEGGRKNRKGLKRLQTHDLEKGRLKYPAAAARPVRPVHGTGQTGRVSSSPVHVLNQRWSFFLRLEVFPVMPPR